MTYHVEFDVNYIIYILHDLFIHFSDPCSQFLCQLMLYCLMFMCIGHCSITIQDMFDVEVNYPTFGPSMIFTFQKDGVLNPTVLTSVPYHHEKNNLR